MTPTTIAAQLYTVRDFLKTPDDIRASLAKVAAAGFQAVQISGMAPVLPEEEVLACCRKHGLTICATHEPALDIVNEPAKVIARLKKLDCPFTAYPHPKDVDLKDEAQVHRLAAALEKSAQALKAAGLGLGYHNHAIEFFRHGGRTALDILYAEAPTMIGEIDTHWVQAGGGDPVAWCWKLAGRMPIVHLKDYGIAASDGKPTTFAIGEGNLNWDGIIPALRAGGCQWYIIEQDNCMGQDPFACLQRSRDFLVKRYC